jgi:hypothetical protein
MPPKGLAPLIPVPVNGEVMPVSLSRPIRCSGCGGKFTRTHGNERKCWDCKSPAERSRILANRATANAVAPDVPSRLPVSKTLHSNSFSYSRAERDESVKLALKLARNAAKALGDTRAGSPEAAVLELHIRDLETYARSVAAGVVPGRRWQIAHLGFGIVPCNGNRNIWFEPKAGPEALDETSA